ncbi:MAG: glutamate--tRNA ligase, partial [Chloroflexota bacterium]
RWLGLDWDEGPHFQSERLKLYREYADRLVAGGHAYYCYCSPQRLEKMRQEQVRLKKAPGYDRHCRQMSGGERAGKEASATIPVVRFATPLEGKTAFQDMIRGEITFNNQTLDDFVLLKSDGYPTYHLANVVDDHLMAITHVLRADEWLSSTPRHRLLYRAFGWEPPAFAHLPMILGPDKSKLSKRHGATAVTEYRQQGYLPEAMVNFLALLGWALDDRTELFTREELVQNFSLERVSKTAAVFNREKLDWMNGVYVRKLDVGELACRALPFLERDLPPEVPRPLDSEYVRNMMPLVQERARTLAEVTEFAGLFFVAEPVYECAMLLKEVSDAAKAGETLRAVKQKLAVADWEASALESVLRALAVELGMKNREFFGLLRVAMTGRTASPPLPQTMAVLGRDRCERRLDAAVARLAA